METCWEQDSDCLAGDVLEVPVDCKDWPSRRPEMSPPGEDILSWPLWTILMTKAVKNVIHICAPLCLILWRKHGEGSINVDRLMQPEILDSALHPRQQCRQGWRVKGQVSATSNNSH